MTEKMKCVVIAPERIQQGDRIGKGKKMIFKKKTTKGTLLAVF